MIDSSFEKEGEELLLYLYDLAMKKYKDCDDVDSLIQDTITVYLVKRQNGDLIEYPKGFLATVMRNKFNMTLRRKYQNGLVSLESAEALGDAGALAYCDAENEALDEDTALEYETVRREIGRLISIYREVTVRHYVHGHTVERIAQELGISAGTVKSRLSGARKQIKEGMKMENKEKYSSVSYEPKQVSLGIWGSDSMVGEPFTLLQSPIEGNVLCLAYEKPISVRAVSDAMGIPTAYIEPQIERLVRGELLGKSESGLIYTRCHMEKYRDSFGDVRLQKSLAEKYAEQIWQTVRKHTRELWEREEFAAMSEKQKATMLLYIIYYCIGQIIMMCKPTKPPQWSEYPERPNGGRWWATLKVSDYGEKRDCKYSCSGPVRVGCSKNNDGIYDCKMYDLESCFGTAHGSYSVMKYNVSLQSVARFYASLVGCDVLVDPYMAELVPEFEALHILRRREDGEIALDIPALSFEESKLWNEAILGARAELYNIMKDDLTGVWNSWTNKIPAHVDGREHFLHDGALSAFSIAVLLEISEKKLIPYGYEVGKTPIIFLEYRKKK